MPLSSPNGCCVRFLLAVELQRPGGWTDVPSTQWPPPLRDFLLLEPLHSRDFRLQWPLFGQLSFFVNIFIIFSIVLCLNSFLLSPYSAKLESVPHHLAKSSMQLFFFLSCSLSLNRNKRGQQAGQPQGQVQSSGYVGSTHSLHLMKEFRINPIPSLLSSALALRFYIDQGIVISFISNNLARKGMVHPHSSPTMPCVYCICLGD